MDITADIVTATPGNFYGVIQTPEGSYDVYAESMREWRQAVIETAEAIGVHVNVWNLEVPEG